MSVDFNGYRHRAVFDFFQEVNNIPRESGNEKQISDYLKKFAQERDLYVRQDEFNNIIIKKNGTKGFENRPAVIIQGHMDMVCVKANDSQHDFSKDPVEMVIDGDFLRAKETTLGADNGIAVAMGMALLDSNNIDHPPIEFVVTTDEEVGLTGAIKMSVSDLSGKYFINMDTEEEGEFVVSCAGGVRLGFSHQLKMIKYGTGGYKQCCVEIKDLLGGHSGMEIDKNRANANRLAGRVLMSLSKLDILMISINGGVKDNVIPSHSKIDLLVNSNDLDDFCSIISGIQKDVHGEFGSADSEIKITVSIIKSPEDGILDVMSKGSLNEVIFVLLNTPNGIQTMSPEIPGLVQSSLNLGVVEHRNDKLNYVWALRSSVFSLKELMIEKMKLFADKFNILVTLWGNYPSWPLKPKSKLEQICCSTYKSMFSRDPVVKGIHAGLEGGVFLEKMPHLEAISFGPDMWEAHSIHEHLSMSSVERMYDFLTEILKRLD